MLNGMLDSAIARERDSDDPPFGSFYSFSPTVDDLLIIFKFCGFKFILFHFSSL